MNWIINFFISIWHLIESIFNLIIHAFESILLIFGLLPEYIQYVSVTLNILPPFLLTFAVVTFGVVIVISIKKWVSS